MMLPSITAYGIIGEDIRYTTNYKGEEAIWFHLYIRRGRLDPGKPSSKYDKYKCFVTGRAKESFEKNCLPGDHVAMIGRLAQTHELNSSKMINIIWVENLFPCLHSEWGKKRRPNRKQSNESR